LGEHRQAKNPRRNFADRLGNAVLVSLNKMLKQRPPSLKRRRNDDEQLQEGGFLVKVQGFHGVLIGLRDVAAFQFRGDLVDPRDGLY
jgi:hypothetical protein